MLDQNRGSTWSAGTRVRCEDILLSSGLVDITERRYGHMLPEFMSAELDRLRFGLDQLAPLVRFGGPRSVWLAAGHNLAQSGGPGRRRGRNPRDFFLRFRPLGIGTCGALAAASESARSGGRKGHLPGACRAGPPSAASHNLLESRKWRHSWDVHAHGVRGP